MAQTLELAQQPASGYAIVGASPETMREALAANLGAGGMQTSDLDRLTVPAGGGLQWTIPSLTGDKNEANLSGIVVGWRTPNAYWEKSVDETGGGEPPDCFSADGVTGTGNPGGACATCPMNVYGTARKGKGKACKNMVHLYLLREGARLPILVSVPPSSIKPVRRYMLRLANEGLSYFAVVTKLALTATKNEGGIKYSEIVPSLERPLSPEELAGARAYVAAIGAAIDAAPVTRDGEDPFVEPGY